MNPNDKDTVLVVDDNETNLDTLVEILGNTYRVSVATDGKSALEAVASNPPDLILLDILMPGLDGYEVCRRLKSNPDTMAIPVIFVTVKSEVGDESLGFEVGCVDYITKPVVPPIVMARVKNHIELSKTRKELEIKNRELLASVKLKEEVDKIATHDLKNPLSAIFACIDHLLMFGSLDQKQLHDIKLIENSAHRMLNMINFSLDMFKMEQGIYKLHPAEVDLLKIIDRIKNELTAYLNADHICIAIQSGIDKPGTGNQFVVKGEELLCYSMLANLIKNAVEASPEDGTVTITLSKAGSQNIISIHNQGEVPDEIKTKFFDKFVTHGKPSGTGLGTYSAKLITQTLNGNIAMMSDPEKGTTVSIVLPPA